MTMNFPFPDPALHLFKVSHPRPDRIFQPSRFWRSADWSYSSSNPRPGLTEENVLYAGEFADIPLHLLPEIPRLQLPLSEKNRSLLPVLGLDAAIGCRTLLVTALEHRGQVEDFRPTVYVFSRAGFEQVPSGEWVARLPRQAIGEYRLTLAEAAACWHFTIHYVADLDAFHHRVQSSKADFSHQS